MASDYLLAALQTVADPFNLGILVLSDFVGLLMGILPGLSATMAIALLTGITYGLPGASALISLVAVYRLYFRRLSVGHPAQYSRNAGFGGNGFGRFPLG